MLAMYVDTYSFTDIVCMVAYKRTVVCLTGCSNTSEANISEQQNNCERQTSMYVHVNLYSLMVGQCNNQLFVGLLVALVVIVLTVLVSSVLFIVWSKK